MELVGIPVCCGALLKMRSKAFIPLILVGFVLFALQDFAWIVQPLGGNQLLVLCLYSAWSMIRLNFFLKIVTKLS